MPRFSIIIVSWNALHHLQTFLPSVLKSTYEDFEVILADNASTDGSREWVREHYPGVKIAAFDRNYGYCGGNNRAVPYADGDILLFLNNDVKVTPGWLEPLARLFEDHPEAAAAQPKMRAYEEPKKFEYSGAAGGYLDRYGYPFCRGRIFDTVEEDTGQYDDPVPILWASGAALAVRREPFRAIGGFDEDFEFHMEEIDLCWQLWNRGHAVRFCPESVVYHLGGGSLPMESPRKLYYNYRNNLTMLWKNASRQTLTSRFSVRYLLDLVSAMRLAARGKTEELRAVIRAHRHFWAAFSATRAKRRKLQQQRTIADDPPVMLKLSVVWHYFCKGSHTFGDMMKKAGITISELLRGNTKQ